MNKTLVSAIFAAADKIHNGRRPADIVDHAVTELGELQQELIIDEGRSYKEPGNDGVIGEAIDTISCLVDLIHVMRPDLTEAQLIEAAEPKLAKWVEKAHHQALYARREWGPHHDPKIGGTYGGFWVVRRADGSVVDIDQYRNDLMQRYTGIQFLTEDA